MPTEFDLVVIGAGMARLDAMDRAVAAGRTVAVIARDRDGGTGPIRGVFPQRRSFAALRSRTRPGGRLRSVFASVGSRWTLRR